MFKEISKEKFKNIKLKNYDALENNPYSRCVVYIENDYIGYIFFSLIYDRIEINYIYVEKEYRRKNIGTKLINYVEKIGLDNKCENISLEVSVENISAIKLYKKCGFVEVAKREKYYSGIDGILMVKKLVI